MVINMLETGKMIKKKEKEHSIMLMAINMMETGKMIKKTEKELFIDSTDQQNRLRVLTWMPENTAEPPVIVQICHGMVEHIERYREFAAFL